MATIAQTEVREEAFYQKMTIGLSAFILFGFLQFAARGFVDYGKVPAIFHVHGAVMVAWLALLMTQATLAARDNLAVHRKLGWLGAVLATLIGPLAIATSITAITVGAVPPFFSNAFFLSLVTIGGMLFTAMVWAAISYRRQTDWHRRLIIGSSILLMEPALGRLLPMPLIGGETGEWISLAIQLLVLGLLVRHDRRLLGRIHPATTAAMLVVILAHVLISLAARLPAVESLAASFQA